MAERGNSQRRSDDILTCAGSADVKLSNKDDDLAPTVPGLLDLLVHGPAGTIAQVVLLASPPRMYAPWRATAYATR